MVFGDHLLDYRDLGIQRTVTGRQDFRGGMCMCHQAMLIPASIYAEVGPYDQQWKLAADLDLAIRIEQAGIPFHHVAATIATFRKGGASDASYRRSYNEALKIIRNAYGWFASRRFAWIKYKTIFNHMLKPCIPTSLLAWMQKNRGKRPVPIPD